MPIGCNVPSSECYWTAKPEWLLNGPYRSYTHISNWLLGLTDKIPVYVPQPLMLPAQLLLFIRSWDGLFECHLTSLLTVTECLSQEEWTGWLHGLAIVLGMIMSWYSMLLWHWSLWQTSLSWHSHCEVFMCPVSSVGITFKDRPCTSHHCLFVTCKMESIQMSLW